MPSRVVTSRPSTRAIVTEHESTGSPSSSTVHRPQLEVSQAHFTDLAPWARQKSNRVASGRTSSETRAPFRVRFTSML